MAYIATFVSVKSFTVVGDKTAEFLVNRRVRCNCGVDGYKYGTIDSSSYSSPSTTIGITGRNANLTSNLTNVDYGIVSSGPLTSLPQFPSKENLLINSGFGVWSNSEDNYTTAGAVPASGDATDLAINGTMEADSSWDAHNAPASEVRSSDEANNGTYSWKIVTNGANEGIHSAANITFVAGTLYEISVWFYNTSSARDFTVSINTGTATLSTETKTQEISQNSWEEITWVVECTVAGASRFDIYAADTTTTYYVDDARVHIVTPGCAEGNTPGPDGWTKDTSEDIFREHSGSNTKAGSFYALKIVFSAASKAVYGLYLLRTNLEQLDKFDNRTMTFGFWAKSSTASAVYARLSDGVTKTLSAAYSDTDSWEWVEVTATFQASPTAASFEIFSGAASTVYISQPMLVFGSSIGEGNYVQPPGEWVAFENTFNLADFSATAYSDTSVTTINLEGQSDGKLPKGAKAVEVRIAARDSDTATGTPYFAVQGKESEANQVYCNTTYADAAGRDDIYERAWGIANCDANGDIAFICLASGTLTLDVTLTLTSVKI